MANQDGRPRKDKDPSGPSPFMPPLSWSCSSSQALGFARQPQDKTTLRFSPLSIASIPSSINHSLVVKTPSNIHTGQGMMEALRAMLACIFGRRRGADDGYTELVYDDKMAMFSDDPYYSVSNQQPYWDSEPYAQHDAMSYFPSHAYGATNTIITTTTDETYADVIYTPGRQRERSPAAVGRDVARLLWEADWNDDALQGRISDAVGGQSWNRKMVEACLDGVIEYVERGRDDGMGEAMCEALDRATDVADEAFEFPRRHPESLDGFIAIVAAGMLADMQGGWVLELLGFGEVGGKEEIEGTRDIAMLTSDKIVFSDRPRPLSFAAWWAREYEAYIPDGSVYSYLQRMDMVELVD